MAETLARRILQPFRGTGIDLARARSQPIVSIHPSRYETGQLQRVKKQRFGGYQATAGV